MKVSDPIHTWRIHHEPHTSILFQRKSEELEGLLRHNEPP